jgi:hypothetical protein
MVQVGSLLEVGHFESKFGSPYCSGLYLLAA